MPATPPAAENSNNSTRLIAEYVGDLSTTMSAAITEINDINADTQLLALNARIEAARAGSAGAAFGVVASEMQALGAKTSEIANQLASKTRGKIEGLMELIGTSIRGGRLSDIALTNVDLVDRNLYERTCDVRWWATDSSLVDALTDPTPERLAYASHRLGVILSAYTVYHDLVLCDPHGRVVANGRPTQHASVGHDVSDGAWFRQASRSRSGDEFGFESAHRSALVGDKSVLIYSCGVREGGQSQGRLLGVLGVLFNWEDFAQTIVRQAPLSEDERATTRVMICDAAGAVLADSHGKQLQDRLPMAQFGPHFAAPKGHAVAEIDGRRCCVAQARAPGFETYSTGWRSVIVQPLS